MSADPNAVGAGAGHPGWHTPPEVTSYISDTGTNPILGAILAGATEFLEGAPVKVVITLPTVQEQFTAKNPFGVVYSFTFEEQNGKLKLIGTPQ